MREPDLRLVGRVALRPQPANMCCSWLPNSFIVVQNPDFLANELRRPHREGVSPCARPADIAENANGHQRVSSHATDAALLLGENKVFCPVGALVHHHVIAFPDVAVLLWALQHVFLPVALQLGRELRVVAPVDDAALGVLVLAETKTALNWGRLSLWVPCHPQLRVPVRSFLSERWDQRDPR